MSSAVFPSSNDIMYPPKGQHHTLLSSLRVQMHLHCCNGFDTADYSKHSQAQPSTAQHSTAQHSTAQHSTAQHSTAQHSTAQPSPAQPSPAQHCTAASSVMKQNSCGQAQIACAILMDSFKRLQFQPNQAQNASALSGPRCVVFTPART